MAWSTESLSGPDGEDWRVPTSELEMRQSRFIEALEGGSAWVSDPVDMYWLVGKNFQLQKSPLDNNLDDTGHQQLP